MLQEAAIHCVLPTAYYYILSMLCLYKLTPLGIYNVISGLYFLEFCTCANHVSHISYIFVSLGFPAPPSDPECFIPCDEKICLLDISCTWDPRLDPEIPTNFSLHWESDRG